MKVLFLDIDGVVNCQGTTAKHGPFLGIDPILAKQVRKIVESTGCMVVLSSTWRLSVFDRTKVMYEVVPFMDITRELVGQIRGAEIKDWLERARQYAHYDITRYAILDDDDDFYPGQPLFKTSFKTGLTEEITDLVIKHLNKDNDG